jgi:protein-tyrosine phosphatase
LDVRSAGIFASPGAGPNRMAVEALAEMDIDLTDFSSSQLTPEAVAGADVVVGMTDSYVDGVLSVTPEAQSKTIRLLSVVGSPADVADPYGGPLTHYRETLALMKPALKELLRQYAAHGGSQ